MTAIGYRRCQAEPIVVRVRGSWGVDRRVVAPRPSAAPSLARRPFPATRRHRPRTTRPGSASSDRHRRSRRASARPPGPSGRSKTQGCDRPRSLTVATIRSRPSQIGPGRLSTSQPVRSASVQLPMGRSSSGAMACGAAEPALGPTRIPGLTSSSVSASMVPIAASQRPSGDHAGSRPSPPRPAPRAAAGCLAVDVDGPDRRPRTQVRLRAAIGGECDGPAIGAPRQLVNAPVAGRDAPRPRPAAGFDDEQVRPAIQVSAGVEPPIGPGDAARGRLVVVSVR